LTKPSTFGGTVKRKSGMAAYQRTQRSSLQFGLWADGQLAPAHIHSSDPSELSQWLCHRR